MRTSPQSAAGIFASMLVLAVTDSGTGRRGAGTGESSTDSVEAVARPSEDTEASVDVRESDAAVRPELRESSDARDCTPGALPCADAPPLSLGGCGWCAQVAVRNGSRRSVCKHFSLRPTSAAGTTTNRKRDNAVITVGPFDLPAAAGHAVGARGVMRDRWRARLCERHNALERAEALHYRQHRLRAYC
jgi:hypothetical protein